LVNILDGFDFLATVQQKYHDAKAVLSKKKLNLFRKWEADCVFDKSSKANSLKAMMPEETKMLGKIRDVYGLFNHEMY
jgi:hypothetical protein